MKGVRSTTLKSRVLDTAGIKTVHTEIRIRDEYIFKGSPFQIEIIITAGKKGVVVNRVGSTVYFQTIVQDNGAAITLLEVLGAVGEILVGGMGTAGHLGDRILRIPLHEASLKKAVILGPGKSKTMKVVPTVPDEYPLGHSSRILMKVEVDVRDAPVMMKEKRLELLPNIFICAPLIVMIRKFGFVRKDLQKSTIHDVPENRFLLVAGERSQGRVKEIHLTSTDLGDGRVEYVFAFEMYERPGRPFRGKHETVMVHFEINKGLLMDRDGSINMDLMEERVREAFEEVESKFGKVQSFRM